MYNCSILKTLTYSPCKFAFRSFSQITTNLKVLPSVVTVEKWERDELLNYLQSVKNELKLDDDDIDIIEKQKVVGSDFLDLSEDELGKWGMSGGPAKRILKHVQKFPKKLKSFSAYRTNADIKDVLDKYRTNDIRNLSRFKPGKLAI
ncbi:hypothetical protein Glove_634g23 [Diversispora epigaea]|uniref:SAM domain-containing protein n=1 Tax=Diversispora epigaea TaxID=1348612 RepID=A0A397GDE0_9GLOM|nr:hypothetical protein Glove_634g23 [Diversispora epigaea]